MSILNTDCDVGKIDYGLQQEGRYAWQPVINVRFGNGIDRLGSVQSIKATMDRYNWTDRIRSQGKPLVFRGHSEETTTTPYDPAHERHWDAIRILNRVMKPRRAWLNTRGTHEPRDELADIVDYYSVRLSQNQLKKYADGTRDVWQWYASLARDEQNVDFVIDSHTVGIEELIEDFSSNYRVPDDRIFMYLPGESITEVNEKFDRMWKISKRHEWAISPRMEFLKDAQVGGEDDESS